MANRGVTNVLHKLEQSIAEGKYYDALQMYRTLAYRYANQKKFGDVISLILSGVTTLLGKAECGDNILGATELADMLVELWREHKQPCDDQILTALNKIFEAYPPSGSECRISFVRNALKWSSSVPQGHTHGHPQLHFLLARALWEAGDGLSAQRHFVRSEQPTAFAQAIIQWSKQGLKSEADLFVARAVLEYLSLGNLRDANIFFKTITESSTITCDSPLMNYLRFLLLTLERESLPLFNLLRSRYRRALCRDETFEMYLDRIANHFYKVPLPQNSAGFFNDMLKTLMGGGAPPALNARAGPSRR